MRWQTISPTTALRIAQRTITFLFPTITAEQHTSMRQPPWTVCYSEELPIKTNTSKVAMSFKPMYKLRLSYGVNAASLRTARISPRYSSRHQSRQSKASSSTMNQPYQTRKDAHLCTATQEPLPMEETILLIVHRGALCAIVGLGIDHKFAVNMLLSTSFIDCIISRIFPADRKVVPWHSHSIAILVAMQRD